MVNDDTQPISTGYLFYCVWRIFRFNSFHFPPVILMETFDCLYNKLPKNGPSRVGKLGKKNQFDRIIEERKNTNNNNDNEKKNEIKSG